MTMQQATTAGGYGVRHMWEGPMPDRSQPAAGFAILDGAKHAIVYRATRASGAYNHHSKLAYANGRFLAMWSNHPHGEDGAGQRVLLATGPDAELWSAWTVLFPAPGPVGPWEGEGLALTALQWVELDGRVFALAACHANMGFCDFNRTRRSPVRDREHPARARDGYSPLGREVLPDGSLGPIFAIRPRLAPDLAFEALSCVDPSIRDVARRLRAHNESDLGLPAWNFDEAVEIPRSVEGHRLCEPIVYRARDGVRVMLLRDTAYSHRMYVSIRSDGDAGWPPAEPTDIPDSPSLSCALTLPGGTVVLIGNQVAPRFDNPDEVTHYPRDPLTVSVSPDGYRFTRVYALRCGSEALRVAGVGGRGPGAQYPSGLVRDGVLYVQHSMGKEDIWVSRVRLADLGVPG